MKWFHHDTDALRNRKIRKVIRTHGVTGYGIWFALLEKLYAIEGDFMIQADELWLEDFADDLKVTDYRTLIRVFDTLAEVGLISSQLWQEHTVYCDAIAERGDAYMAKRAKEAAKKRRQRSEKAKMSHGDVKGTGGQKANVPPADPDLDLSIDLKENNKDLDRSLPSKTAHNEGRFANKKANAKKPKKTAADWYAAVFDKDAFEKFWIWYKKQVCSISGARAGNKADAARRWVELEESDFWGVGIQGFRVGCLEYLKQTIKAKGIGTRHACNFLSGGEGGEPEWYTLFVELDSPDSCTDDFLQGVDLKGDIESVRSRIGLELIRLNRSGVLPDEWQEKTGCLMTSELSLEESQNYLKYLKSLEVANAG